MPDTKSPQEQLAALRERRLILELEREQRLFESEERAAREERVAHARGLGVNLESLAVRAAEERNAAVRRAAQEESPAADAFALHESYSYYDWFDQAPYGQATDWGSVWGTGVGPILNPISTRMDRRQGRMLPFLQTEQDLMLMRGVARIITTLSCPAQGVLNALTNYVVGEKGFQFTVDAKHEKQKKQLPDGLIEAVQDVLQEFSEQAHWEDLQAEMFLRSRRDGEYFLALYESPGGGTKVRIFEPEQITQTGSDRWTANYIRSEHGQELVDSGDWYWGILTPLRDVCEVHGFNVYWDMLGESEYLPAAAVQHFKLSDRNVKRGLSDFYPAFRMLQKSGNLANKIVSGAAVQAGIAYIRQHPAGRTQSDIISFRAGQADSTNTLLQPFGGTRTVYNQIRQEAGILDVPNGQEYKYGPMGAPSGNQFIDVLQASLRWVACKWNMPEFLVSGDASNNNMASSLVAESPFVKSVRFLQHRYGPRWVSVLWKVIEHAAAWGRFDRFGEYGDFHVLRRVLAISVGYPDVETRNRKEESDRRKQLCDDGMISPATRCAEEGYDYEKEVAKGAKQRPAEISAQASGIGADGQVTGVKAKGGGKGGNNQGGAGPGTEPPTDGGPGSGGSPKPPEGQAAATEAPEASETEATEPASVYETSTFEAKDAAGHEHKGKGPGGGQFTSSGDSGGSSKENPSKPKAAKPKPSTPGHAKKPPTNPSSRDEVADKIKGKAFKDWFGDWQHDPENASKVVDASGQPLIVYHGTTHDFDSFDKAKQGSHLDSGDFGAGFYFGDRAKAEHYGRTEQGGKLMPVYLNIKRPFVIEGSRNQDVLSEDHPAVPALKKMFGDRLIQDAIDNAEDLPSLIRGQIGSKKFTETLQRHGYDGFLRKYNPESYEWTAFEPNQIKSAVHNRGTFDRNSDKITETTGSVQPSAMLDINGYGTASGMAAGRLARRAAELWESGEIYP